jgi:hypothetical protein
MTLSFCSSKRRARLSSTSTRPRKSWSSAFQQWVGFAHRRSADPRRPSQELYRAPSTRRARRAARGRDDGRRRGRRAHVSARGRPATHARRRRAVPRVLRIVGGPASHDPLRPTGGCARHRRRGRRTGSGPHAGAHRLDASRHGHGHAPLARAARPRRRVGNRRGAVAHGLVVVESASRSSRISSARSAKWSRVRSATCERTISSQ